MLYTDLLILCKKEPSQDEIGNTTYTEKQTEVYAKKNVVGSKEFYNAMAVGIRPTAELQILLSNYNNESECIYEGQRYSIIRTLPKGRTELVLVLSVKTKNNG